MIYGNSGRRRRRREQVSLRRRERTRKTKTEERERDTETERPRLVFIPGPFAVRKVRLTLITLINISRVRRIRERSRHYASWQRDGGLQPARIAVSCNDPLSPLLRHRLSRSNCPSRWRDKARNLDFGLWTLARVIASGNRAAVPAVQFGIFSFRFPSIGFSQAGRIPLALDSIRRKSIRCRQIDDCSGRAICRVESILNHARNESFDPSYSVFHDHGGRKLSKRKNRGIHTPGRRLHDPPTVGEEWGGGGEAKDGKRGGQPDERGRPPSSIGEHSNVLASIFYCGAFLM